MPDETLAAAERNTRVWRRENRLRRLGFDSYTAYRESVEWRSKRRAYWQNADTPKDCAVCGGDAVLLHHKTYERVGEEDSADLAPLCDPCHRIVHELERRGDLALDFDGLVDVARRKKPRKADPVLDKLKHNAQLAKVKANGGRLSEEFAARQERRKAEREQQLA